MARWRSELIVELVVPISTYFYLLTRLLAMDLTTTVFYLLDTSSLP